MANTDTSSQFGFTDKRRGRGLTSAETMTEKANMGDIPSMRTRLIAINSTYYTAARLDVMTENDMIYALRDAASI
jgi:hypothetical protein